jgi:hypothetical protein
MTTDKEILIGREQECALIRALVKRKTDIIVFGEAGVGKSSIIRKLVAESGVDCFLYSERGATLKEGLLGLIAFKGRLSKGGEKKSTLALKKICYGILESHSGYVVFDHVGWIEPRFYGFLTYTRDQDLPVMIVSRGVNKENIGQLWRSLYTFEQVEITNLDKARTEEMIKHYAARLRLNMADGPFRQDVFRVSNGNPAIVKRLCMLAKDKKYYTKGYPDVKLMDLDRRINESTINESTIIDS